MGQYFDGEKCQEDEEECCDPCIVFCQEGNIETADPTDCKSFYFCRERGFPLPQDKYRCPDGETFDAEASMCIDDALATCVQPCAITTTTSTTTTTTPDTTTPPTTNTPTTTDTTPTPTTPPTTAFVV